MTTTTRTARHNEPATDTVGDASAHNTAGLPVLGDTTSFPSHAELARTLLGAHPIGTIATLTPDGHPYTSVAPYSTLADGSALICISDLAEHTRNLQRDGRASLLVQEPCVADVDPLSLARATLIGAFVPHAAEPGHVAAHLDVHPHSRHYVDFDDFSWWRFETLDVRYIGGFGVMGWATGDEFTQAEADPIVPHAAAMVDHLNTDHSDACREIATVLAGCTDAESAHVSALDRRGITMDVRNRDGAAQHHAVARVAWPSPLDAPDDVRSAAVDLVRRARSGAAS